VEVRIESAICSGCSCLCDDLDLTVTGGRIVEVANACRWGVSRLLAAPKFHPKKERRRIGAPLVRRQGRWETVPYEAALAEATRLLTQARRPVIYGLTNLGSRAQEAALALAQHCGARLEPADLAFMAAYYQSLRQHEVHFAPLEVIRDEADTVLFWGANPLHSVPRHVVRHSVFARGRYTERGVEDRRVAAVDLCATETAKFCHLFLQVEPGAEAALIEGVAAALSGAERPGPRVRGTRRLADFLARATYGVIFCGRGVTYPPGGEIFPRLAALAALLNRRTPFTLFPLPGDFNARGLYHLLLRELGSPLAPDFGTGNGTATPVDWHEVDAVLVAGADLFWGLREEEVQDLKQRQVPLVVLSPFANRTTGAAQVLLPSALAGVEAEEVAYRLDGLPVALGKLVESHLPPDYLVLADLTRALQIYGPQG
jgi:formylmethanofuran dehydrogenase subunit B